MIHPRRTHLSRLLNRALVVLPATLLVSAACSSGGNTSGSGEDGGTNGTGTASGGGGGNIDDDGAAGNSSGATASSSGNAGTASGSGSGGASSSGNASTGSSSSGGGASSSGGGATSSGGSSGGQSSGSSGSSGGHGSSSSSSAGQSSGSSGSSGGHGSSSSSGGSSSGGSSSSGGATSSCTIANASCTCSNSGCNVGSYYLYDHQWNCGSGSGNSCGPESAYGCANSDGTVDFVVTSNQPAGNTAVLSYPAMQDNFDSTPALSSFTSISATFEETSPHVGDYEVAWDCWFNSQANEFMVWVDNYNQTPGGSKVASNVSLDGRSWDVWWSPSSGTGGYVVFYANTTVTSGTVNLLALFQYGASHGWLPSTSTVDQLSFGIEVCSTNGQNATWTISNYSITTN
jgi:hypothetical protein